MMFSHSFLLPTSLPLFFKSPPSPTTSALAADLERDPPRGRRVGMQSVTLAAWINHSGEKGPDVAFFAWPNTSPSSMLPQQFQFLICTETCETVRVMKYQIAATCCFCLSLLFYLPLLFDLSTTSAAEHMTAMPHAHSSTLFSFFLPLSTIHEYISSHSLQFL